MAASLFKVSETFYVERSVSLNLWGMLGDVVYAAICGISFPNKDHAFAMKQRLG